MLQHPKPILAQEGSRDTRQRVGDLGEASVVSAPALPQTADAESRVWYFSLHAAN